MQNIKIIQSQDTYSVRQPVLRPGKPIESCVFIGDDDKTTVHFGIYCNDILAGILSIFKTSTSIFPEKEQYQMRGMAILPEHQKKGLGEKLLYKGEEYIKSKKAQVIWFNARENAVQFYKKTGFEIINNSFNIPDIGIHYIMYKKF
ncbi:MAG: GNAT family N-acetyltransferase [Flavobacterium sp. MedPE-SWcel]|uniref:GNAT family N-acetyltransferase n=1 Tax=uncultured Flavobacterium sp. TaxID=165435 RepID=UPI000917F4C2|nr:GNAT family N-acetyltransferase [uncultured Flavobacterium sp.]OIQ22556.1 MAG: GNAT family N-acetyltransferase [Flavobacterium sp. MedPE-SWcel]